MPTESRLVVVGATGEVGGAIVSALEDAGLAIAALHVVASPSSVEETVMFKGRALLVEALDDFDFSRVDVAVFAVPTEVAARFVPKARAAGCRVIDHSAAFRLDDDVPLVLAGDPPPEADLLACPGPLAAVLAPVLRAIGKVAAIESVQATILSPVSSQGRAGVRELAGQTGELLNGRGISPVVFPVQMAFNTLPVIGEEAADILMDELERLLPAPVPVALAEVSVPVFYGMTLGLRLQTRADADLAAVAMALERAGVLPPDAEEDQGLATPVTHASGQAGVHYSGLQSLPAPLRGMQLWLVADNIQQGAVRQSVDILSKWIKRL